MGLMQKYKHKTLYNFPEGKTNAALNFLVAHAKMEIGQPMAHMFYLFVDSFTHLFTQQTFSEDLLLHATFCETQTWSTWSLR